MLLTEAGILNTLCDMTMLNRELDVVSDDAGLGVGTTGGAVVGGGGEVGG